MVRQVEGLTRGTVRETGEYGIETFDDDIGGELRRLVDQMDTPFSEARSRAQFERFMVRMTEEEAKRKRLGRTARRWARMAWAVSTAAIGAGAFRLFAH